MTDLYKILELEKSATPDEIRRAYRRLSMKWHPDKNNSSEALEKFQDISKAYSVLSDPAQKAGYDRKNEGIDLSTINLPDIFKVFMGAHGGPHGVPFGFPPGVINMGMMAPDFMNLNFGAPMGDLGGDAGNSTARGEPNKPDVVSFINNLRKPPPIITNVTISLNEAYHGVSMPIKIKRWIASSNTKTYEEETIYIAIPQGADDNEIIVARDKGHVLSDTIKGDVKVFIRIENSTEFKRHGLDLDYTKIISLKQALCGFSFEIEHINGTCYKINNTNGTIIHPSYKKTVPKKGMKRDGMEGNLNIHFIIEFPKSLSQETINQIRALNIV